MSFTHTFTKSLTAGGVTVAKSFDVTDGSNPRLSETLAGGTTNGQLAFAFDTAKLKSIWILANKDMSIFTNAPSTGAPGKTIALKANLPYEWNLDDGYFANPFAVSVTTLYYTTGGVDTTFVLETIVDPEV